MYVVITVCQAFLSWLLTVVSLAIFYLDKCHIEIRLFQKNIKQGELRIWNFQSYQRNSMRNFQGLIRNKVKFPSVTNKK